MLTWYRGENIVTLTGECFDVLRRGDFFVLGGVPTRLMVVVGESNSVTIHAVEATFMQCVLYRMSRFFKFLLGLWPGREA